MPGNSCTSWTTNSSGVQGFLGKTVFGDYRRWYSSSQTCNNTYRMICSVRPAVALTFTDVSGATVSTQYTATTTALVTGTPTVSVSGDASAEIQNQTTSSAWGASVTVNSGDTIAVRVTSSASSATTTTVSISVAGVVYSTWNVSTVNTSGYFVMSSNYYAGNFGDLSGANALCLTELQRYDWMGRKYAGHYGYANSTTNTRWLNSTTSCNSTLNLLCVVNPP